MKFTLSTKPLVTAANLVIINSNVNKFDHKSVMVQVTADHSHLYLNTESNSITSEIKLAGVGSENVTERIFVDALVFKSLLATIKGTQVELEFSENALLVRSGKSSFSVPAIATAKDGSFKVPAKLTETQISLAHTIDISKWKFIKEHQMYAKAESYALPVYTYAWLGKSGDVLVGDLAQSLFTHSNAGQLDMDCLVKDTIINLITSLPEDAKLVRIDDTYVLYISADSYEYRSQIVPSIESEQNGSYNADQILDIMKLGENTVKVDGSEIITVLNQSSLLTVDKNPKITVMVDNEGMHLKDARVNAIVNIEGEVTNPYVLDFKSGMLKALISNCPDTKLDMCPRYLDGEAVGVIVHTKDYTAILAGSED